jgi:basic amino acid/polyamine antiporter, APA family
VSNPTTSPAAEAGSLSLWDAVSLIVGIVIGSTVFKTPGILVFANVSDPWTGLALWIVCGGLSFVGALCYAELATTYPRLGGDYNYLTRAFGRGAGFLFGWAELAIIQTGSIGALAYVSAEFAVKVFGRESSEAVWFALAAVVGLTLLNCLGLQSGKRTQNVLTVAKGLGLLMLIVGGFSVADGSSLAVEKPPGTDGWPVAMILVLYAYGGWNDAAFVAADVRDRRRNIPRALLLGIGLITGCYVLVNGAYLAALGFEGLRASPQPAADAMARAFGTTGERAISILVMISALGSVNGLIFSVSRLNATVGSDHAIFALMGRWSTRTHAPIWSLLVQGAIAASMIVCVGTDAGRNSLDSGLAFVNARPVPWRKYFGGFDTLFAASAPIFWLFFLKTGVAYFVLRWKDRDIERPFRAPLFPLCPLLFCLMCVFGLYSATTYALPLLPLIAVPFLLGVPLYFVSERLQRTRKD